MASVGDVESTFQLDIRQFKRAVRSAAQNLLDLKSATSSANTDLDDLEDIVDSVGRDLEDMEDAADGAADDLDDLEDAAESASGDVDNLGDQADGAGRDLDDMGGRVDGLGGGVDDLAGGMVRLASSIGPVGVAAAAVAAGGLAALGTSIAVTGVSAVKGAQSFSEFEKVIRGAAAKTGDAVEAYDKFSESALKASEASAFTGEEAGQALENLASAGLSVQQSMDALPGTLQLATAGQIDLAQASDIATNVLAGMGLGISELNRVNNVLVATSNKANTGVGLLGQALSFAAPKAKTLGVSLETTSALLGQLANQGTKGTRAGRGLRAVMSALQAPTDKLQGALDQAGVSIRGADGEMRDFTAILSDIQQSGQMKKIASSMGRNAGAIIEQLAPVQGEARNLIGELENLGNAAADQAEFMERGLAAQLDNLQGSFENLKITVGQQFAPAIKDLIPPTKSFIVALKEGVEDSDELGPAIARLGDNLETLLGHLEELVPLMVDLLEVSVKITGSFPQMADGAAQSVPVFGQMAQAAEIAGFSIDDYFGRAAESRKAGEDIRDGVNLATQGFNSLTGAVGGASGAVSSFFSSLPSMGDLSGLMGGDGGSGGGGDPDPSPTTGPTAAEQEMLDDLNKSLGKSQNELKAMKNQLDDVSGTAELNLRVEIANKKAAIDDIKSALAVTVGDTQKARSAQIDAAEHRDQAGDMELSDEEKQRRNRLSNERGGPTMGMISMGDDAGGFQAPDVPTTKVKDSVTVLSETVADMENEITGVTGGLSGISSSLANLRGVSDATRRGLNAASTALDTVGGVASQLASGNIFGAVASGIGGLISTIGAAQKREAGRADMATRTSGRQGRRDFAKMIGEQVAKAQERLGMRSVNVSIDARGALDKNTPDTARQIADLVAQDAQTRNDGPFGGG